MPPAVAHFADFQLAQRCLDGDNGSVERLQTSNAQLVTAFLVRSGATPWEAAEVLQSVWSHCLVAQESGAAAMAHYDGTCALLSWLNRVALNRLISWKRSAQRRQDREEAYRKSESGFSSGDREASTFEAEESEDAPLREIMRAALERGFSRCSHEHFVMLQLTYCDGLRQYEVAKMFGCDPGTISRALEVGRKEVENATLDYVRTTDPLLEIEWEDFLMLCRSSAPSCLGVV